MFIKRDLRKIDEILCDESDSKEVLKLSNRKAEFEGSIRILCRETRIPSLSNLRVLNLYGNDIDSLQGIGTLSQTPIEEINLGNNRLTTIPIEVSSRFHSYTLPHRDCESCIIQFGSVQTLKTVWLEE